MPFLGYARAAFLAAALAGVSAAPARAQESGKPDDMRARIDRLVPAFETYLQAGMKAFDVPGVAIGIVQDDRLVYAKGFGVRETGKTDPVGPDTVFQIGSTTKAFLSTVLAQEVDAGRLAWSDRVVDLDPAFRLSDPWVERDFRVLDLTAQRSGLTPYVNDGLTFLGYDPATLVRSLSDVPLTETFRSDFTYTNILHLVAGEIAAKKAGIGSWPELVKKAILDPLGMTATTATPEAIAAAPDHATGHRRTETGPVPVPFHAAFPYALGPAGDLNSTVTDLAQWLRLQLGRGQFGDRVVVSEKNLDVTWTPRVAMNERLSYALGWVVSATPNGRVVWHNGGTTGFGAHVGFLPDRGIGVVVLTNAQNAGFPDAVAQWLYDRLLGNPTVDNVALALAATRTREAQEKAKEVPPAPRTASAEDLASFAGTYASRILGDATVTVAASSLRLKLEETDAVLLLTPRDEDVFDARLEGSGAYAPLVAMTGDEVITQVRFERGADGAVTGLRWTSPALPQAFARQP